jgi:hypothetical protein
MTGKFHTSWGDFHSFKNLPALQFECFRMLALGAKCSVGDQLHPSGAADHDVYDLIGAVYSEVERKEPWCKGATPVVEIGVLTPEEFLGGGHQGMSPALMGATRMLEESAQQFDVLDSQSDLAAYKVLILPDNIPVGDDLRTKLEAYLAGGGAMIASFESGMDAAGMAFTLPALGVRLKSEGPRDPSGALVRGRFYPQADYVEYVMPEGAMSKGLRATEHAAYLRGMDVEALPSATVLVDKVQPYFDRTWEHFCSHRQTPSSGQLGGPAVVRQGQAIYFAHPLFTEYQTLAPRWDKQLFLNALDLLLPEPLVRHGGPSTLQIALNEQTDKNRWVAHLLHYIPERRGQQFDVIEDVIPLYEVELSIRAPRMVQRVSCVPDGQELAFAQQDGYVVVTVPRIEGHQMLEIAF